jgi:peptide/nickel transport system permease protein
LIGLPRGTIAVRLILPTVLAPLSGVAGLLFGQAILSIAALGFLGLGLRPPTPEWGAMILDSLPYLQEAPLLFVAPSACIALIVAGLLLTTGPRA